MAYQPLPDGNRIALVTNAGGPAALAADALEGAGLRLARTGADDPGRTPRLSHPRRPGGGPVDLLGGADEHGYRKALDAVLADPACDGVLAILVPQALVNPVAVVQAFGAAASAQEMPPKPVLACLMGEASLDAAFRAAHAAQIPAYTFPEDTVAAFGVLWQRSKSQMANRRREEAGDMSQTAIAHAKARREVQTAILLARSAGRQALDTVEARPLLEAYGIPTPPQFLATSPYDAVRFATEIGYPVVLKLISPDILHKTDIGGVILDVKDEKAVNAGFEKLVTRASAVHPGAHVRGVQVQQMITGGQEVIVGIKRDPTFGPLIMFGLGGVYVEALADVSFRLAPLTAADAWEMLDEVRSARLLTGLRGTPPADRAALVDAIVRVGQLAADHPEIAELDINPLLVLSEGQGVMAVDARIILG